MKHLVVIGFMGSGKSAFSLMLSRFLNFPIFSTDEAILMQMQMPISKIFEVFGEDFFRKEETKIFQKILQLNEPHIIDCGGGFGAYQEVEQLGNVVFLDIAFQSILERMNEEERAKRPLFDSLSKAKSLFIERREIYLKKAQIVLKQPDEDSIIEIKEMIQAP